MMTTNKNVRMFCPRCDCVCTPVGVHYWRCLQCGYKFMKEGL